MSQQRPLEGHWWSLGQQKLSGHCLKMADPIWRHEDSGSDESRVKVVLLACKDDTVSPAFLIESADLKIVETVDGVKPWWRAMLLVSIESVNKIGVACTCVTEGGQEPDSKQPTGPRTPSTRPWPLTLALTKLSPCKSRSPPGNNFRLKGHKSASSPPVPKEEVKIEPNLRVYHWFYSSFYQHLGNCGCKSQMTI
ncbi:hypothetical protein E2C01_022658 [Portunus trituberculatus]|uniref:Uncharacterized protein n=1 Tax=Portunus trituberculatus TaxID=210409 RepID=A0A5B7E6L0_PORTR|nr:hypothetical protein [Portunus trituberculatus]